jgi:hypothetical protein
MITHLGKERNMTHATAEKLLKSAIMVLVILGGLILAMASHPALAAVANLFIDLTFWPVDGSPSADTPAARVLGAIGGGGFFGWGVCMWIVVRDILPVRPDLAQRALLTGILCWFAVDSTGSLLAGAWFNAVMNIAILLALMIPLRALSHRKSAIGT